MGGVERKPIERKVEQRVGWNPASNSEGEEGFVVREVQGRRAPLNCSERFRGFLGAHSNANRSIDCRIRAELESGFRSPRNELADSAGPRQYGLVLRPPWVPPRPRYLRRQRKGKSLLILLVESCSLPPATSPARSSTAGSATIPFLQFLMKTSHNSTHMDATYDQKRFETVLSWKGSKKVPGTLVVATCLVDDVQLALRVERHTDCTSSRTTLRRFQIAVVSFRPR